MRRAISVVTVLLVIAVSTVAAQDKAKTAKEEPKSKSGHEMAKGSGGSDAAKIARAMSAAPPSISKNATIMEMGADGKMKTAQGRHQRVDVPARARWHADVSRQEMAERGDGWMNKRDPQVKNLGLAYMLKGDKGASNTDPYADKASADNQWVVSGPHVMVIVPDPAQLDALPTEPQNGGRGSCGRARNMRTS